ncbi:hypothetical protein P7C70_g2525, partial [Phenoliferia sp. Uapishka_3]
MLTSLPPAYINAETTGGGTPGWVTTLKGSLRSNSTDYTEAWTPYIKEVCRIAKPYQISEGGPIILFQLENELTEREETRAFFNELKRVVLEEGIVVPTTFNDWGPLYQFSNGTAQADIFQAGAFDPWGPNAPGYDACRQLTGPSFESAFIYSSSPFFPSSPQSFFTQSPTKTTLHLSAPLPGIVAHEVSDTLLVLYADSDTAGTFWSPLVSSPSPYQNCYGFGTNETILVGGPYLVRNASIEGSRLDLVGDLEVGVDTKLVVFAPSTVRNLSWNGEAVDLEASDALVAYGALVGKLSPPLGGNLDVPALLDWSYKDSLPELTTDFDDSSWIEVLEGNLSNPYPPYFGDKWLYSCELGFCEGVTLFRGTFGSGQELAKAVNLSLSGGEAFAGSVYLNDICLGSSLGNSSNNKNIVSTINQTFHFPPGSVRPTSNILTVLVDNMGQDQGNDEPKHPRGIQGYALVGGGDFTSWRAQGSLGGRVDYPDRLRGITNEGGFYAERQGWHIPGFDVSTWEKRSPMAGLPSAGVGYYTTKVSLRLPPGFDTTFSLVIEGLNTGGPEDTAYRAQLYDLNKLTSYYLLLILVPPASPQTRFPLPPGILDHQGENTIGVLLWALGKKGAAFESIRLEQGRTFSGGVGVVQSDNPQWTPR